MKSILTLLFMFCLTVPNCHGSSLRHRRAAAEIYKASSNIEWSIYTSAPQNFTSSELFELEESSSNYIMSALMSSPEFERQTIYTASFDVMDQDASIPDAKSTIRAQITAVYGGKVIEDFRSNLQKVISTNDLLLQLEQKGLFHTASTASVKFPSSIESYVIASSRDDTVLFIILLSFVVILIIVSFAMLITSGVFGCCQRQTEGTQDDGIKMTMTDDTAESHGSPVLGARRETVPPPDDSRYDITPIRGSSNRHLAAGTPSSQRSKMTEYSIDESTTSANPLGIVRLHTLNKIEGHVPKNSHSAALYSVSLRD